MLVSKFIFILGYAKLKSKILPKGSVIVTCIGSDMGKIVLTIEDCITKITYPYKKISLFIDDEVIL